MSTAHYTVPEVRMQDLERSEAPGYQERISDMAQVLCWFEMNDPQPEYAQVSAITETQHEIRSRLHYVFGTMPWESQTDGDCYSFSWHTSLALDELGISHFIAFTHGHAYCIALDSGGNAHMVNTDQPAMNDLYLTDGQFSGKLITEMAEGDFGDEPRAVVMSTDRLKHRATLDAIKRRKSGKPPVKYPWVDDALPATVIMTPEIGKRALYIYNMFTTELANTGQPDVATMHAILSNMKPCNPQQETRPRHNEDMNAFKKYVKRLLADKVDVDEVAKLIDNYYDCMPADSKSMDIYRGDLLRLIAEMTDDDHVAVQYATKARENYIKSMSNNTRLDQTRKGKLRVCSEIITNRQKAIAPINA